MSELQKSADIEMKSKKHFVVATAINWGAIEIEWFSNQKDYKKALNTAKRNYARGDVDTYICGDNETFKALGEGEEKKLVPIYSHLWIAHNGDDGLFVEAYDNEKDYEEAFIRIARDPRVDKMDFNGVDFSEAAKLVDDDDYAEEPITPGI